MSKYTIKLEQLISSETFGDVAIVIQYDAQGPKIISIQGDTVSEELIDQTQHFLNIYNFLLTKGISAAEASEQLVPRSETELKNFLALILSEVSTAPDRFQDIKESEIIHIDSETLKALM